MIGRAFLTLILASLVAVSSNLGSVIENNPYQCDRLKEWYRGNKSYSSAEVSISIESKKNRDTSKVSLTRNSLTTKHCLA